MKVKAEIVVQSHLSDFLIDKNQTRIEFVKFLIDELEGDLTQDIDPKDLFEKFLK